MLGLKGDMQEKNIAWGFESNSFPESSGGCLDVAISRAKLSCQKLSTSFSNLQPASYGIKFKQEEIK